MAGVNPKTQKLVAAASIYRIANKEDYYAGILDKDGFATMTSEFNKIWNVTRYDINRHLVDLADNQKVDNPIASIYGWPGKGNPFFSFYNLFTLPNDVYAPFFDKDNNGIYDPSKGDYPLPEGVDKNNIPEMTTWTVFNDNAKNCSHGLTKATSFSMEVHQTTWGFNCSNSSVVDNTNFISYKIHYKGAETIDSTFLGIFTDPDIGCYEDDYIGCSPKQNSFFVYNRDEIDGIVSSTGVISCKNNTPTWKVGEMPVGSVTLLNKNLDGFMYFNSSGLGTSHPATINPDQSNDFYRYLNSTWKDGTPLTEKDLGYNPNNPNAKLTKYAFSGNPNDTAQYSMRVGDKGGYRSEAFSIGVIKIGQLKPNQIIKIDMAFTVNRKKGNTVSQNLDLMYKNIDSLQAMYNQGFKAICTTKKYCEGNDCLYPGDANKDGIVNYKDAAWIATAVTDTGVARVEPLIFAPLDAKNWTKTLLNGANMKYLDADGNGLIDVKDKYLVDYFYNQKTPTYQKTADVYPIEGKELTLSLLNGVNVDDAKTQTTKSLRRLQVNYDFTSVVALGFQLEIDSNYIKIDTIPTDPYLAGFASSNNTFKKNTDKNFFIFDIATSKWDKSLITSGKVKTIYISGRQLSPIYPSQCTKIRFKNVVAFTKDGKQIELTAKDLEVCFTDILTDTDEAILPNPIQISPNPFENTLNIRNFNTEKITIELCDVVGKVILIQKINGEESTNLDTQSLSKGIYFLRSSNGKQQWTSKVVKQ